MTPPETSGEKWNATLLVAMAAVQAIALLVVPLLLTVHPAWGWLLAVPVLLTYTQWALIHEAMHGLLFRQRRANRLAGRLQAILFGAAFDLLKWGHLLHHALNRTPRESAEVFAPGGRHPCFAAIGYYFRLLGGLYVFEVIGSLVFLLPRNWIRRLGVRLASERNVVEPLVAKLLKAETRKALRIDAMLILLLYTVAFALYGEHAWLLCLVLCLRALLISLLDNAFHYGTPLGDTRSAHNLRLPEWTSRLILRFNLHGVHHAQPALPWHRLAAMHAGEGHGYHAALLAAMVAQLRGPIAEQRLLSDR